MKGISDEAEVVIRLDKLDGLAHVCVHAWPEMFRKYKKRLGEPYDNGQTTARWKVPSKAVTMRALSSVNRVSRSKGNPEALRKARLDKTL